MEHDSIMLQTFTCLLVPESAPPPIDLQAKIDEINDRMAHLQQSNDALRRLNEAIDRFRAGEDLDAQLEPLQQASPSASPAAGDMEPQSMTSSSDSSPTPTASQETGGSHPTPKPKKRSKFLKIPKFGEILRGPMLKAMAERERAAKLHLLELAYLQQSLEFNSQISELAVQIREYRLAVESQAIGRGEAMPDSGSVDPGLGQGGQQALNSTMPNPEDLVTQGLERDPKEEDEESGVGGGRR